VKKEINVTPKKTANEGRILRLIKPAIINGEKNKKRLKSLFTSLLLDLSIRKYKIIKTRER
jgi:hypothetical protein